MFHDRARIHVQAGRGGDGALSFRREKFVPKGGPDGGDGGPGGDVVLVADPDLRDLSSFRAKQRFKAGKGGAGGGSSRHGASGEAVELRVPVGTQVLDEDEQLVADLAAPGARLAAARGGAGGRGNRRFASPTRQTPRFAETGIAGEEATLELRLKLLADAALAGLAERREVVAPGPDLQREAEGRRVPLHDAAAGARHRRVGRAPARGCRRAGPDRGSERGRRPRPRVPRPPRAGATARARDRRGRGRSGRGVRGDQPRARGLRRGPRRAAAGGGAEQDRPPTRAADLRDRRPACRPRVRPLCRHRRRRRGLPPRALRALSSGGGTESATRKGLPTSSPTGPSPTLAGASASCAPTAASASPARPPRTRSWSRRSGRQARRSATRSRSRARRSSSSNDRDPRRDLRPAAERARRARPRGSRAASDRPPGRARRRRSRSPEDRRGRGHAPQARRGRVRGPGRGRARPERVHRRRRARRPLRQRALHRRRRRGGRVPGLEGPGRGACAG